MPTLKSGLTAELLVDNAVPKLPAVSPDGSQIAYLVSEMGDGGARHTDLWLAAADGSKSPVRLATGLSRTTALRWAPDGAHLFYLVRGELWRMRLTGEAELLGSHDAGIFQQFPFFDGRRFAVITGGEMGAEWERREESGDDAFVWGEQVPPDRLWIFDAEDASWSRIDAFGDRHVVAAAVRPDDAMIAVISWATALDDPGAFTARLQVVDLAEEKVVDLGAVGVDAGSPVWWSAGGQWHLAYIAAPIGHTVGYGVFDVQFSAGLQGRIEAHHRSLTEGMGACPLELVQVSDSHMLVLVAEGLDSAVYRVDPAHLSLRRVLGRPGHMESLAVSARGDVIAALASSGTDPNEIHAGPVEGPLTALSATQRTLVQAVEWGTQERISYQAADGLELEGLLVLPAGKVRGEGPFPLVTLVHGGPYVRHADAASLLEQPCSQWLAAHGYAVFLPNPRGSLGRGPEFAQQVVGAVGQEEWSDILTGIDMLVGEKVADPDRLGITGWSHGGFLASWAVGQTDRFKAAVVGAGISDWGLQIGAGELGTQDGALVGSFGWEEPGAPGCKLSSPISFAFRIRTPVLLLHGEEDPNVPLGQALYLDRALRRHDVEHQLVVYPREGHGIWERAHQIDVLSRTVAWFDKYLVKS